ncbi:hypothetical protein BGY98DRAFT_1124018 [Russula aff. rugulosa BPL654]|nr:hypothetical protein BGY98DRAFT_1124018 [Russula aff. rugulosa BPL654]
MPPSPQIGHILRRWRNGTDLSIALIGNCIIARIIACVPAEKRDDTWMALARSQLEVTEEDLMGYLEQGDSVLLANLINTTRLFFKRGLQFQGILWSISGFNVKKTLPELQRDFFPMATAALPILTSYALCPERQSHHPVNASQQVPAVVPSSPSSPLGVRFLSPPLQHDETNINSRPVLDTPPLPDPYLPLANFLYEWFSSTCSEWRKCLFMERVKKSKGHFIVTLRHLLPMNVYTDCNNEQISESETMEAKVNERYDLAHQVGGSEIYFVGCT